MPRKVTHSQEIYIKELYFMGKMQKEICNELGLGKKVVMNALIRQGVQRRSKSETANKIKKVAAECCQWVDLPEKVICERYNAGESSYELANAFNTSEGVIRKRLRKNGIKIRTASESGIIRKSRMTTAEKFRHAQSTSQGLRGKPHSLEHRCALAISREKNVTHVGKWEFFIFQKLIEAGFNPTQQKALGPYNIDISIDELSVAVEVITGAVSIGSEHGVRIRQKIEYLSKIGWSAVIILAKSIDIGATDYLIRLANLFSRDKTSACQYHVIRGDGKLSPALNDKIVNGAGVISS
ncbi:MAG: hypothetical protein LBV80_07930 [Deltaproteobacteria bacterium]|nr:hypothetical protein [Deltaproteobacteria bacterium]